jgi:hypothetical protein
VTSLGARKDLEICVRAANGDVGTALDLRAVLQEVKSWEITHKTGWAESVGRPPEEAEELSQASLAAAQCTPKVPCPPLPVFPPSPQRPGFDTGRRKVEHPQNWRTVTKSKAKKRVVNHPLADFIPSYSRGATPHDATPGSLFSNDGEHRASESIYDLIACRRRAGEERRKREEAMRQAGKYFKANHKSNGLGAGKEVAAFYAAEARKYETTARIWELRAARELVKQQR